MYASPSTLPETARTKIAGDLNAVLADGLDLVTQIKTAHWNVKGPHFASLHPLFETFAVALATYNDDVAERAVALGAIVPGTARHAVKVSRIPELPAGISAGLEFVAALADRFDAYLKGLRSARETAEANKDVDTVDLLTGMITAFEKNGWFLRASLEGV
jgi:starvation-inducible DNA-binding protein